MDTFKKSLIIAHYHRDGLLRDDLIRLIKHFKKNFSQIVFVSTKLKKSESQKINNFVKVITRANFGYDFYSYKVGIEYLKKKLKKKFDKNDIICLFPSSLIYAKPEKLLNKIEKIKKFDNCVFGLSKSWEIKEHLQSEMFIFSMNLFNKKSFSKWWTNIKKFKSRQIIIFNYEIGFSEFLSKEKIEKKTLFTKNINDYPNGIIKLIKQKLLNIFFKEKKIYKKNPLHFYWKEIYDEFGVLKIELLKANPHNIDMSIIRKRLSLKLFNKFKKDSMNN